MPNPIRMYAKYPAVAHFMRNAAWMQRITIQKGQTKHVVVLPGPVHRIDIAAGQWKVTHEFLRPGSDRWEKGKGRLSPDGRAVFDDGGPTEGDFDFNDATVTFAYLPGQESET